MSVRDDLIAAKALIDAPEKWAKRSFHRGDTFCALGACEQVTQKHHRNAEAAFALMEALPWRDLPHGWSRDDGTTIVAAFNDMHETTHADIMALFDRAIAATP